MGGKGRKTSSSGNDDWNGSSWGDENWAGDGWNGDSWGDQDAGRWTDGELDSAVRRGLDAALPGGFDSHHVLEQLRPTLQRARRRHRTGRALVGAALSLTVLAAVGLVIDRTGPAGGADLVATGPDSLSSADSAQPADARALDGGTDDASPGDNGPDPSTVTPPNPTATVLPPASSQTTGGPTSTPPTTTIEDSCGSLVLSVDGQAVTLIEALPAPGARAEVKNAGPQKVEVGMEGAGHNCEIVAVMTNGSLQASVHNEEGGDDDDEHRG